MSNDRLRAAIRGSAHDYNSLSEAIGVDPKTVQRWVTTERHPHRRTADRVATLLEVPLDYLWPDLLKGSNSGGGELINFYPHRNLVPKQLWLELATGATERIEFLTYASLFFGESNPDAISLICHKAANDVQVRFVLGDPNSEATRRRGEEEEIPVPDRIRMALAYYQPLIESPDVSFHLHETTLYNSIYRFDDQMLVNQHIYGTYGYIAPILHIRKVETSDLFETYERSFELVWGKSMAYEPAN